ncbi:MAG: sensor histidine kinase [Bacteroidales bacterium]|nr:sensor histidine kinase [Bacteroidales bacterium]
MVRFTLLAFALLALHPVTWPVSESDSAQMNRFMSYIEKADEYTQVNTDSALFWYNQAMALADQMADTVSIARSRMKLGDINARRGNYSKALEYYLSSLRISEAAELKEVLTDIYNNMAILYDKTNRLEEAMDYYLKSYQLDKKAGNKVGMAYVLNNMGNLYMRKDQTEKARDLFEQALNLAIEANDTVATSYMYGNLGDVYRKQGKLNKAKGFYIKGLKIFKSQQMNHEMANSYLNLGLIANLQDDFNHANDYLFKGLKLAKQLGMREQVMHFYKAIADHYYSIGDYRKAYETHLVYSKLSDTLYNAQSSRQMDELRTRYEIEKKSKEIELLRKEDELKALKLDQKNLELRKSQLQNTMLWVALLVAIGFMILLYQILRIRNKNRRAQDNLVHQQSMMRAVIDAQETERDRFARDIHDGIGQYLSALKMTMNHLQSGRSNEHDSAFDSSMNLVDDVYRELRNVSFNIMPPMLQQKGLIAALEELVNKLGSSGILTVHLHHFGVTDELDKSQEIAVYRIIQELLNNIIKYSGAREVEITITGHTDMINIMIEDDGNGFDPAVLKQGKGNGWKNIQSRLEILNGELDIDSHPGRSGTTIVIDIPKNSSNEKITNIAGG